MLSRFVENAALESAAQELILQAHMMVNEKHFNALHLKIKIQIVVQCLIRNQNRCFIYLVAFYPPITRKLLSAVRARFGVAGHMSITPR